MVVVGGGISCEEGKKRSLGIFVLSSREITVTWPLGRGASYLGEELMSD